MSARRAGNLDRRRRIQPAVRLALFAAALLSGCLASEGTPLCRDAADCGAGEVCTRTRECVPEERALRIVVSWRVHGEAPTPADPAACDGIAELEVLFLDPGGHDESFRPVPCEVGRVTYDIMPPRLERVVLRAFSAGGAELARAEAPLAPEGEVAVDLNLAP